MTLPPRITFEEESGIQRKRIQATSESKFASFVMRISGGNIKNSTQANAVLLICAVLCVVATIMIMSGGDSSEGYPEELKILPAI